MTVVESSLLSLPLPIQLQLPSHYWSDLYTFVQKHRVFRTKTQLFYPDEASLTVPPPADGCSFDQHALIVPVQKVLQVLLFFGLGAQF